MLRKNGPHSSDKAALGKELMMKMLCRAFRIALIVLPVLGLVGREPINGDEPIRILLSNDDGFQDPGLQALVTKLAPLGELTVAAPSSNQSGVGHGMTFKEPFAVESWTKDNVQWYSIAALPATCVRLALTSLLKRRPDVVVAGINRGENVGIVTFSSGTIACAREAAFYGIPGISVNLQRGKAMDYEAAADFVAALVKDLKDKGLPPRTYLNVNYPALPRGQIKGVMVTRQDTRPANERYEKSITAEGKTVYRSLWTPLIDGEPDSDTWAITHGFISVTPFQIDQTERSGIEKLKSWNCLKTGAVPTKKISGP
jgi:5'-nucleotidase